MSMNVLVGMGLAGVPYHKVPVIQTVRVLYAVHDLDLDREIKIKCYVLLCKCIADLV